jgi:hypothetical protein
MKKFLTVLAILIALVGAYYAYWRSTLSDHVARVEATIVHHNEEFRKHNRWITLKADSVEPAGFPFKAKLRVDRPTLTFVWGKETYGASFPYIELQPRNERSGSYDVLYPVPLEAVYAADGKAPEEYSVELVTPMPVILRAQGDSRACPNLPGTQPCKQVGATDPLISFAAQLPHKMVLKVGYLDDSSEIGFETVPLPVQVFMAIPKEADRPLQVFVNMLREAMIFQKDTDWNP